jgi:hypothetical protein
MHVVKIKIVHAAWLRDNTWPPGAVAPDPDDILLDNEPASEPLQSYPPLSTPATEYSSGVTTPWMAVNREDAKMESGSGTTV